MKLFVCLTKLTKFLGMFSFSAKILVELFLGGTTLWILMESWGGFCQQMRFPDSGVLKEDCIEMNWIESILYFVGFHRKSSLNVLLHWISLLGVRLPFKVKSNYVKEPISKIGLEGMLERFYEEEVGIPLTILTPNVPKYDNTSKTRQCANESQVSKPTFIV